MSKHVTFYETQEGKSLIEDLQKLVSIKSVDADPLPNAPFGKAIDDALQYMLDLGASFGFETVNVDHYAGHIEFGQGEDILGILCHLDVVPGGEGWQRDPFDAYLEDGKLYGRGTQDDKGPAMTVLYAMKRLKESGYAPNMRVRLILGTNEESGQSAGISKYLEVQETPTLSFSPDADFPVIHGEMGIVIFKIGKDFEDRLDDGGVEILSVNGGNAPNMVPDTASAHIIENRPVIEILNAFNDSRGAQLSYQQKDQGLVVTAKGTSAHGSMPEKGHNAIADLLDFLDLIDLQIGDSSNFIRFFNRVIGREIHGESFNLDFSDEFNRLVFNLGMIEMNQNHGSVTVNVRYPITLTEADVKRGVEKTLNGTGYKIEAWRNASPLYIEKKHPLVVKLMDVYRDVTGDVTSQPITIGGGTYARSVPNAVAFGALFPNSEDRMHQKDECISVEDLSKLTDIYEKSIIALTS